MMIHVRIFLVHRSTYTDLAGEKKKKKMKKQGREGSGVTREGVQITLFIMLTDDNTV